MLKFDSFKSVSEYIKTYEKEHYVELSVYCSKRLDSSSVKNKYKHRLENVQKNLTYYSITYNCTHGGKYRKNSTCVNKRNSRTRKFECSMRIRFSLTVCGQFLQIAELSDKHNHEINKEVYHAMPKQRRLDGSERVEALKLLKLKCDKKMIKSYVKQKTGKVLTLRDLTNLNSTNKTGSTENELFDGINFLQRDITAVVNVLTNEEKGLVGIFYQDKYMQRSFRSYPEVLLCDATYKLNNLRMPLYILLVINGNGKGEVAATFLLASETEVNISHMIKIFKDHNEKWENTKSIITDKDFKERHVFSSEFPHAQLVLCLFHTLKTFRTQITVEKMNITAKERDTCLEILSKLSYSKNEEDYNNYYKMLIDLELPKVSAYYNKNWHDIKHHWVEGFKLDNLTFNVTTTNHLESLNQKIKQVVTKMSNLKSFYEDLLIVLETIKDERKQEAFELMTKKCTVNLDEVENKYSNFLTPFAFKYVQKHLRHAKKYFAINENYETTINFCKCHFRTTFSLPCGHIFWVRMTVGEQLYEETLVDDRFTKQNFILNHTERSLLEYQKPMIREDEGNAIQIIESVGAKTKVLTNNEKFRKTINLCQQLAGLMSESGTSIFNRQYKQLETFIALVKEGKEVQIIENSNTEEHVVINERSNTEDIIHYEGQSNKQGRSAKETKIKLLNIESNNLNDHTYYSTHEKTEEQDQAIVKTGSNGAFDVNQYGIELQKDDTISTEIVFDDFESVSANLLPGISLNDISYANLKFKRVGRPKGVLNTVIGLNKKNKRRSNYKKC